MSYYCEHHFLCHHLGIITDERQARLKEAETLGRRQESEVLIFSVKISNILIIRSINHFVKIKKSKSFLSLQVTTAEGLVGAWLGVTARLNFRFIFILAPIIIVIIVDINFVIVIFILPPIIIAIIVNINFLPLSLLSSTLSLSSVTDMLSAQAVHHHQQGYMNAS